MKRVWMVVLLVSSLYAMEEEATRARSQSCPLPMGNTTISVIVRQLQLRKQQEELKKLREKELLRKKSSQEPVQDDNNSGDQE